MRRLIVCCLAAALLAGSGCHRNKKRPAAELTEEEAPSLASVVQMADPKTSTQLLRGFHALEQNAWRWTESKFSVRLRPPRSAAQKGATLDLRFSLPEPVAAKVGKMTLTAKVNGVALAPETLSVAGDHVYSREVPASALAGDAVTVEFAVDKFLPAGSVDQRELAIVVTSVGLETK